MTGSSFGINWITPGSNALNVNDNSYNNEYIYIYIYVNSGILTLNAADWSTGGSKGEIFKVVMMFQIIIIIIVVF